MDNINRKMRNRLKINNNIPGINMEPEGNEYMNVRKKKAENDTIIEGQVQRNIQQQNAKIRQLAAQIGRLNLLRLQIKGGSPYLMELDKAKSHALKTKLCIEMVILNRVVVKELKQWIRKIGGQSNGVIDQQNNNTYINNRLITIGLGSNTDI
ncbi:MAG: hypothetical protein EZS28_022766 [Streblomastix strix]|uniref:Uncharacterized protein n=1 Tax=Streblomastix strix TaxID=222440 RepID=A0A5J4VH04_9EUKA|nr:MAG: hypothetical protein EZS28_022766 [Streblomastix strix]